MKHPPSLKEDKLIQALPCFLLHQSNVSCFRVEFIIVTTASQYKKIPLVEFLALKETKQRMFGGNWFYWKREINGGEQNLEIIFKYKILFIKKTAKYSEDENKKLKIGLFLGARLNALRTLIELRGWNFFRLVQEGGE